MPNCSTESNFAQDTCAVSEFGLLHPDMPQHRQPKVANGSLVGPVDNILSLLQTAAAMTGKQHRAVTHVVSLAEIGSVGDRTGKWPLRVENLDVVDV